MDAIEQQVQQIFAELTRYPVEILDLAADLEEELGIDSVKRAEIFVTFQERFGLPESLEVPPERLRTIGSIADVIRSLAPDVPGRGLDPATSVDAAGNVPRGGVLPVAVSNGHRTVEQDGDGAGAERRWPRSSVVPRTETERAVIDTIANVMSYPRDILSLDADMEEDLGIDSAKRDEILATLGRRLAPTLPHVTRGTDVSEIRSIADVVEHLAAILDTARAPSPQQVDARTGVPAGVPGVLPPTLTHGTIAPVAKPFDGKIALVTGSGHGIGRAIAMRLAELGASVIVNSFHSRARGEETTEAIRAAGGQAEHMWASVANPGHLRRLFAEIESRFGCLDFFVSNASNGAIAPLRDVTNEHWDRAFRTNIVAFHQGALMAAHLMKRRGGGKIMTLSSPGAHRYIEYFGCMGPIKAAVESLTRYLAIELASDNIQVNAVSVGPIYGELLRKYPDSERLIRHWESLSAGNKLGEETDVANFVTYLLSNEASKVTGSVLLLDSGGSQRI
jgi:NAD(P)-dependent dehydrogenase (short-subunit alcohol dehydrogenase family)/acyl carrier protein